jgi:hypothetical protein
MTGNRGGVFTIDIDPDNILGARKNLEGAGYGNVTAVCQDGMNGLPSGAPYDCIIATCSIKEIPPAWLEQLKEGGVMIAPIWINGTQISPAFVKKGCQLASKSVTLGGFMSMRDKTFQELASEGGLSKRQILVCSEHDDLFKEKDLISLLRGRFSEIANPLGKLTPEEWVKFYVFMAVRERNSLELFLNGRMNGFGFSDGARGIVDMQNHCACLFSSGGEMFVYGKDLALKTVESTARAWDVLGRPGVGRFQFNVFPCGSAIPADAETIIIAKKTMRFQIGIAPPRLDIE